MLLLFRAMAHLKLGDLFTYRKLLETATKMVDGTLDPSDQSAPVPLDQIIACRVVQPLLQEASKLVPDGKLSSVDDPTSAITSEFASYFCAAHGVVSAGDRDLAIIPSVSGSAIQTRRHTRTSRKGTFDSTSTSSVRWRPNEGNFRNRRWPIGLSPT